MTLTIDLPRSAEARLEDEEKRTGVPMRELAARMLLEHMKLYEPATKPEFDHRIESLSGSVIRYDDPFGSAANPDGPHVSL